jgi:hypothetical protein
MSLGSEKREMIITSLCEEEWNQTIFRKMGGTEDLHIKQNKVSSQRGSYSESRPN